MYAVRARFSASSIRAAMRAVPFFFDVTMWKPFVRRRDFPFSPSIESIERNREEITDRDRSCREIDQFPIETKKKEIEKYIRRANRFLNSEDGSVALSIYRRFFANFCCDRRRSHDFHLPLVPIGAHAPTPRYKGYADKGNKHPRDRSGGGSLINRIQLAARENKRPFPLLELRSISSFSLDYYSLVSTVFSGWRSDNLGRHHLSFIRARFSLYREERS